MRFRGTARGAAGRVLAQRTVLEDGLGAFGRVDDLASFDLELDDGRTVRVDLDRDVTLRPRVVEEASWPEIESDPVFAAVRDRGPKGDVDVVLKRDAVRDGDDIVVEGEEGEWSFDDASATMRDAPSRTLASIVAHAIAVGPDADVLLDEPPPAPAASPKKAAKEEDEPAPPQGPWLPPLSFVIGGAALAVGCVGAFMQRSPMQLDAYALAIELWAFAAYFNYARTMPTFVRAGKTIEDAPRSLSTAGGMIGVATATFVALAAVGTLGHQPGLVRDVLLIALALLAVAVVRSTRATTRIMRSLAAANVTGIVADDTPVKWDGAEHAVVHVVVSRGAGADGGEVVERIMNKGCFLVEDGDDVYEVVPSGATWGSAFMSTTKEAWLVPIGARVVVAGRTGDPRGKKRRRRRRFEGEVSFYATPNDADPRAIVRALVRQRTSTIVVMGVAAALIMVLVASRGMA